MVDRVPPHNLQAERAVLAAVLLDESVVGELVESLRPEDFYLDAHREIYGAMVAMYGGNKTIDLITLADYLQSTGKLEVVGGPAAVCALGGLVSTAANVSHWAKIVTDMSRLRRLILAATEITAAAYNQPDNVDAFLDHCQGRISDAATSTGDKEFKSARELVEEFEQNLEEIDEGHGRVPGIKSGFDALDALTVGFRPEDYIVLAADSSWGKTALAMQMVYHVAVTNKGPTYVASLDQAGRELVQRMLSSSANISLHKFRVMRFNGPIERDRIRSSGTDIKQAPLWIDSRSYQTVATIRARCRWIQRRHGLAFVVIDYLQLLRPPAGFRGNHETEIAAISHEIKALAKDLQVPVLALSQVNEDKYREARREGEKIKVRTPQLRDLRESKAIGHDANLVMMLHQAWKIDPSLPHDRAQLWIVKQKQGTCGHIDLIWDGEKTKFGGV